MCIVVTAIPGNWPILTPMLLFDDNKIKMARKWGKKQMRNPAGCAGEGKRRKGNKRKVLR